MSVLIASYKKLRPPAYFPADAFMQDLRGPVMARVGGL
jgi:hypothetical protein